MRIAIPSSGTTFLSKVAVIRISTVVLLLAFWQAIAISGLLYQGVVPQPLAVLSALVAEFGDATFYRDLAITLFESFTGFFAGSAIAVVVGIWLGSNPFMRRAFEPYIHALGSTPKIIFLPILFLVFGLGIESKIAKAAMSAFFPVVFSTITGFLLIDKALLNVGRSFNLSLWQMGRMIYLPAMLRPLFVGFQLGIAMSIIGVLSAEIAYANIGLGARLIHYSDAFNISAMYAVIVVIFAVTSLVNSGFSLLQRPFLHHERSREGVTSAKQGRSTAATP